MHAEIPDCQSCRVIHVPGQVPARRVVAAGGGHVGGGRRAGQEASQLSGMQRAGMSPRWRPSSLRNGAGIGSGLTPGQT